MEKEFVSYEIAKALKTLGFNEKCFTTYDNYGRLNSVWNVDQKEIAGEQFMEKTKQTLYNINKELNDKEFVAAPLYQQVLEWLRRKHYIMLIPDLDTIANCFVHIRTPKDKAGKWVNNQDNPLEYYAALDKAIKKAIKLI